MASGNASSMMIKTNSHTNPAPRTCMCAPTNHPGSFRCSMHKKPPRSPVARTLPQSPSSASNVHGSKSSSSLTSSLSLSTAVKASSLKAILLQIIKPNIHDHHRRKTFQPKPTRFSLMNGNRAAVAVS